MADMWHAVEAWHIARCNGGGKRDGRPVGEERGRGGEFKWKVTGMWICGMFLFSFLNNY
jgi:hypothetical protein